MYVIIYKTCYNNMHIALVFFGKHPSALGVRTVQMTPSSKASSSLFYKSAKSWIKYVINPITQNSNNVDIFMHSWSPEISNWTNIIYKKNLMKARHDDTMYSHIYNNRLMGKCNVRVINCERTISQLISIYRAVSLKREHEIMNAFIYDAVIVSRHDLLFKNNFMLPETIQSYNIWFPFRCDYNCIKVPEGHKSCKIFDMRCNPRPKGILDWTFLGSSPVSNRLADTIEIFHDELLNIRKNFSIYVSTHFLWLLQSRRHNLSLNHGMYMVGADVLLVRHTQKIKRFWYQIPAPALKIKGDVVVNRQCPFMSIMACDTAIKNAETNRNSQFIHTKS